MPTLLIDKLKDRVERLRKIHRYAMEAFHAYEEIQEYRNTLTFGPDVAKQHANDIGKFKGFMVPAERGLSMKLHIELAKLFVPYRNGLHIPKLISFAKESQAQILASSNERDYKGEEYPGLTASEWQELEQELAEAQPKITRLKTVRDKQVAHENLTHPDEYDYNSYEDFSILIGLSEKILNKIPTGFYGEMAWNNLYRDQVINDTRALLAHISSAS